MESTVAIQCEDGGSWMHRVIEEASSSEHNQRSYIVRVMKTDRLMTWNTRYLHNTPITTQQYLW